VVDGGVDFTLFSKFNLWPLLFMLFMLLWFSTVILSCHVVSLFISAASEVSNLLGTERGRVETAMNNSLVFLVHQPPLRQFGVGVGAGWLSGYVFIQVSRLAAILGGCTALALWVSLSLNSDPEGIFISYCKFLVKI